MPGRGCLSQTSLHPLGCGSHRRRRQMLRNMRVWHHRTTLWRATQRPFSRVAKRPQDRSLTAKSLGCRDLWRGRCRRKRAAKDRCGCRHRRRRRGHRLTAGGAGAADAGQVCWHRERSVTGDTLELDHVRVHSRQRGTSSGVPVSFIDVLSTSKVCKSSEKARIIRLSELYGPIKFPCLPLGC